MPSRALTAGERLRDELLDVLGDDLVGTWLHGGTTFADRPAQIGDLDICAVVANLEPGERSPRSWRGDPASRPSRLERAAKSIGREHHVTFDTLFLPADEIGSGRPPSKAFDRKARETSWPVYRAHWLAGQYVPLHGQRPEELVVAPTPVELRRALHRELEHLERHVLEGDADDPDEATYAVLNGARILHTLETGSPVLSKRSAGAWARGHLPERWHRAIDAAGRSYDGAAAPEDVEVLRGAVAPFVAMVRRNLPATRHRTGRPRWS